MGSATTAAAASFQRARERASHQASGVPTISSTTVVTDASSSVSRIGTQRSASPSMPCAQALARQSPVP